MKWWLIPLILVVIGVSLLIAGRLWISSNFEEIINRDPNRKYQIDIENIKMRPFLTGISLRNVSIHPLAPDSTTTIKGQIAEIRIGGISLPSLVMDRSLEIGGMEFIEPKFSINFVKDTSTIESNPAVEMRQLFGDILSRALLQTFKLIDGSIEIRNEGEEAITFAVDGFNILGVNISTDSLQWQHMIPFQSEDFSIAFKSLRYAINPYTRLDCGPILYSENPTFLRMEKVSLSFTENLKDVSDIIGVQKDMINLSIDSLHISGLNFSYDSLTLSAIDAGKIVIDSLSLHDYRDKNKMRPDEPVKPLFEGMFRKIPIPLLVDTILVRNTDISYSEMPEGFEEFGTLSFNRAFATIYNFTNNPEYEMELGSCDMNVQAYINDHALVKATFNIPYNNQDYFVFQAGLDSVPLEILNPTLLHMAGITIPSGTIHRLDFKMNAYNSYSENQLIFDYDGLKINIINEKDKKSGLTWLANSMIRSDNMPGLKNYRTGKYRYERNMYRGPFNMLWNSLKEGLIVIVPSATAQKLAGQNKKEKTKK